MSAKPVQLHVNLLRTASFSVTPPPPLERSLPLLQPVGGPDADHGIGLPEGYERPANGTPLCCPSPVSTCCPAEATGLGQPRKFLAPRGHCTVPVALPKMPCCILRSLKGARCQEGYPRSLALPLTNWSPSCKAFSNSNDSAPIGR